MLIIDGAGGVRLGLSATRREAQNCPSTDPSSNIGETHKQRPAYCSVLQVLAVSCEGPLPSALHGSLQHWNWFWCHLSLCWGFCQF